MKNSLWLIVLLWLPSAFGGDDSRQYADWKECYRFMAEQAYFPTDDQSLFRLAAESSADWFWLVDGSKEIVVVVKLDARDGPYSALRGAQQNGLYFLFTPNDSGYRFIGTMEGNSYRRGTINGKSHFTTGWHMSSSLSYENIYDWDGTNFNQVSHILYRYSQDGTRQIEEAEQAVPGYRRQSAPQPEP